VAYLTLCQIRSRVQEQIVGETVFSTKNFVMSVQAYEVILTWFEDDKTKRAIGFRVMRTSLSLFHRNHFSYISLSDSVAIPRELYGTLQ